LNEFYEADNESSSKSLENTKESFASTTIKTNSSTKKNFFFLNPSDSLTSFQRRSARVMKSVDNTLRVIDDYSLIVKELYSAKSKFLKLKKPTRVRSHSCKIKHKNVFIE
jgi:hypothetical protein